MKQPSALDSVGWDILHHAHHVGTSSQNSFLLDLCCRLREPQLSHVNAYSAVSLHFVPMCWHAGLMHRLYACGHVGDGLFFVR